MEGKSRHPLTLRHANLPHGRCTLARALLTAWSACCIARPVFVASLARRLAVAHLFACTTLPFIDHPNTIHQAKWETNLDEMVQKVISSGENNKFFWLTATTVFREGFEAVVFITPFAAAYRPLALIIPR